MTRRLVGSIEPVAVYGPRLLSVTLRCLETATSVANCSAGTDPRDLASPDSFDGRVCAALALAVHRWHCAGCRAEPLPPYTLAERRAAERQLTRYIGQLTRDGLCERRN